MKMVAKMRKHLSLAMCKRWVLKVLPFFLSFYKGGQRSHCLLTAWKDISYQQCTSKEIAIEKVKNKIHSNVYSSYEWSISLSLSPSFIPHSVPQSVCQLLLVIVRLSCLGKVRRSRDVGGSFVGMGSAWWEQASLLGPGDRRLPQVCMKESKEHSRNVFDDERHKR